MLWSNQRLLWSDTSDLWFVHLQLIITVKKHNGSYFNFFGAKVQLRDICWVALMWCYSLFTAPLTGDWQQLM